MGNPCKMCDQSCAGAALFFMQAGVDDAAKAAGLAAGHIESSAETVAQKVQAGIEDAAKAAGLAAGHIESSAEAVAQKVGGARGGKRERMDTSKNKDIRIDSSSVLLVQFYRLAWITALAFTTHDAGT
jgi:hypothetical protein